MFERRPIWGIIVGLNVCVLIWLISVQEPVMYDASTAIISSSLQQQQQQQQVNINAAAAGGAIGAVALVSLNPRGGRDDRDVKEKQQQQQQRPQYRGQHLLTINNNDVTSTLTTLNLSGNNNTTINNSLHTNLENHLQTYHYVVKTTTDAINSPQSPGIHALTSSLGTGVLDVKVKPTPTWMKVTAVSSALPPEDFNHLIELQHFHYLVPQPVCSTDIQALILVHSAPKNQLKRQIIRETWASIGRHTIETPLRVLFLLGAVEDALLQDNLLQENNQYGDMIQGSFVDDYRNMTYKHVMAFKWFLYNCPEAQILIKVDDDVYVNTPQLLKYLKEEQWRSSQEPQQPRSIQDQKYENPTTTITTIKDTPTTTTTTTTAAAATTTKSTKSNSIFESLGIFTNSFTHDPETSPESITTNNTQPFNASEKLFHRPQNLLFCQKMIGSLVKRSYRSKWRVGFKEYAGRYYPPYCPGYAIIYSPDVIFRLYTAAQESKYFWIDDVHITGVLAQQTNTTITTSSHYVLYSDECDRLLTGKTDLNDLEFLFAWHSITARQIKALWHLQMMSRRWSEEDSLHHHQQKLDNTSSLSSSSSSSLSTTLDTGKGQTFKNNRLSYNITNYITSEGFR